MDLFGGAPGGVCFSSKPDDAKPSPRYVSTGAPGGRVGKPSSGLTIRSVGPPPGVGMAKVGMRSPGLPTGACDDAGSQWKVSVLSKADAVQLVAVDVPRHRVAGVYADRRREIV